MSALYSAVHILFSRSLLSLTSLRELSMNVFFTLHWQAIIFTIRCYHMIRRLMRLMRKVRKQTIALEVMYM